MAAKKKTAAKKAPAKKAPAKKPVTIEMRAPAKKPNAAPQVLSTAEPEEVKPAEDGVIIHVPKAATGPEFTTANSLVGRAMILEINNTESSNNANAVLVELAAAKKAVKAKQDHMLQPAQETVKRIKALWDPMLEQLTLADKTLRDRQLRFINEQRAIREAEQKKLLTDAVSAQAEGDLEKASELAGQSAALQVQVKTQTLATGGYVQTKELTKFEVTDLGAVPREYLELSNKAVNAAIKAGVTEIPGIRIYKDATLAVGSGSAVATIDA